MATTETTLFIYDKELFRDADYTKDVVFEGARVMTANRLAEDGKQWVDSLCLGTGAITTTPLGHGLM